VSTFDLSGKDQGFEKVFTGGGGKARKSYRGFFGDESFMIGKGERGKPASKTARRRLKRSLDGGLSSKDTHDL